MSGTKIDGTVALVTGANRGIGRAIAEAFLERGASKVYAAARNPEAVAELKSQYGDRVVPLALDVTDAGQVREAAASAGDVSVLVNNAGVAIGGPLTEEGTLENARHEMEVNYFALLQLTQKFAPVLAANGGGTVVNVSSVAGLSNFPMLPTYSASKAAVHSLTQGFRALLAGQGTRAIGVYPGPVDTDLAKDIPMEKATPADVANRILDGIESGAEEIFPDPFAADFGKQYESSPKTVERQMTAMAAEAVG